MWIGCQDQSLTTVPDREGRNSLGWEAVNMRDEFESGKR